MTDDGAPHDPNGSDGTPTPAEPITLTDPDGSVTRVASWSSWTREQLRASGGEPLLVTRLDEGQLWFAAGRRRSPWRHQVQAGPVVVTTPDGRFQVIAEADGGATVVCLAGRTRVVSGLREPVVLGPNQTASISGDGTTLVVSDAVAGAEVDAPADDAGGGDASVPASGVTPEPGSPPSETPRSDEVPPDGADEAVPLPPVAGGSTALAGPIDPAPDVKPDRRSLPWLPEIIAVAAIVAVLMAAAVVLLRQPSEPTQVVAGPRSTQEAPPGTQAVTSTQPSTTTEASPTSTEAPTTTATESPPATTAPVPVTTTAPPALLARGTAVGTLTGCRRAEGGVQATVAVAHRSGSAGTFAVAVGLVDASGTVFVTAEERTPSIDAGGTAPVDVLIPVEGAVSGRCELIGVRGA